MKPSFSFVAAALLLMLAALSGCRPNGYYEATPQPPQPMAFEENFLDNRANCVFRDAANNAEAAIAGGLLRYTYYPTNPGSNTVAINTGAAFNGSWTISTRMRTNNYVGLVFGVSPERYGYSFFLDPIDKKFAVYDEGASGQAPVALLDWTASATIHADWNNVEVTQQGGMWTGYINGTQVFTMAARPLVAEQVGFIVLENTTAEADYLRVEWQQ